MIRAAYWNRYLSRVPVKPIWQELEDFQTFSPQQARLELSSRLLAQIHYFGSRADALPEWREAAAIKDPEELWRVWPSLPIVSKHDLKTRFQPAEMKSRFKLDGLASSTGGSTGEPTPYFHDRAMLQAATAAGLYCRSRIGWRPGMPVICVWGSERDIGKHRSLRNRINSYLLNFWLIDGYALDHKTVDSMLKLVARHSLVAIYGFTSMLEFVAREILRRGDLPPSGKVRTAWNGGEMLFDTQSDLFQQAFGVPILNFYGGRELSAMAYQLSARSPLHVLRPLVFVEIVDDNGKPLQPGMTGRLIWTSTVNRGTPFLRYDVGDLGCYGTGDYDESGIFGIRELQGRQAGLFKLHGKTINCLFWNHLFKEFSEVEQFQVALLGDQQVHLRLKGTPFTPQRENECRQSLKNLLGPTPVTISWLEKIPLTQQGKLVQVVRESQGANLNVKTELC
jgi:phenylacetate-CoA ligase